MTQQVRPQITPVGHGFPAGRKCSVQGGIEPTKQRPLPIEDCSLVRGQVPQESQNRTAL